MKRLNSHNLIALALISLGLVLPGRAAYAMFSAPKSELQLEYEKVHHEREALDSKVQDEERQLAEFHRAIEKLRFRPIANRARIADSLKKLQALESQTQNDRKQDNLLVDREGSLSDQLHLGFPFNLDPNQANQLVAAVQANSPEASARPFLRRTPTGSMLGMSVGPGPGVDGSLAK